MEKQFTILGFSFIFLTFLGFYLAFLYGRKTSLFKWKEYIALIIWPILAVIAFAYFVDIKILNLFLISCFAGFVLEYIIGLAYHKTLNRKLWTYGRLNVDGYTSLLSIPIWGIGGVFFWFLSKMVGL